MRISTIVLMLSAGLMIQPAWAHHHDDRRDPRDDRREAPRLLQHQQPVYQRDPREFQQYQRPPQERFDPRGEQFARPNNNFSPGDAARRAQQMNGGGRILAVDPNGPGYRVKVLKEGEVRVFAVPGY